MSIKNRNEYFGYLNKPIADCACINNSFHKDLYARGRSGFIINYVKSGDTFRSINLSEIVTESGTLDKELVIVSMMELNRMGLPLPVDFNRKCPISLIGSYILNSSLCTVEVKHKNGVTERFFTTKSQAILLTLSNEIAESEKKKSLKTFETQFTTTYEELCTGIFQVIKLTPEVGGLKFSRVKININSNSTNIHTMYSIGKYIDSVCNFLSRNKVVIEYLNEDGDVESFVTSLIPTEVATWLRTKNNDDIVSVINGSQNPYSFGELILPNLYKRGEYRTFGVLDIKSIKIFD